LLEAACFVDIKTAILSLPAMIGLFTDAMCPTSISDSPSCLDAIEDVDDLLFGESGLTQRGSPRLLVYERTLIIAAPLFGDEVKVSTNKTLQCF
jgi:hypothetical protein